MTTAYPLNHLEVADTKREGHHIGFGGFPRAALLMIDSDRVGTRTEAKRLFAILKAEVLADQESGGAPVAPMVQNTIAPPTLKAEKTSARRVSK
jgi:hypothetical protein